MRYLIAGLLISSISLPSLAVDGYKSIKFGMTVEQVKNTKLCNFEHETALNPVISMVACSNLSFSGHVTTARGFFISGKLARFSIDLANEEQGGEVVRGLSRKYGADGGTKWIPISGNEKALDAYFDKGTIIQRTVLDTKSGEPTSGSLIYTIANYDDLIKLESSKVDSNDL